MFVGDTAEFDESLDEGERTSMKDNEFDQFMVILFLHASDQTKYGKMQDECRMAYANKKDNPSKFVVDMADVMRQVKVITRKKSLEKGKSELAMKRNTEVKSEKNFLQRKGDGILCNICGKPGELAKNCTLKMDIPIKK